MSAVLELSVLASSSSLSGVSLSDVTDLLTSFGLRSDPEKQASERLHRCARTTREQRRYIQQSRKSSRELARELGVNEKTINKWRSRGTVDDAQMGPQPGTSRVLTEAEKALIVSYCIGKKTSLDVLLAELKQQIPKLTRSTLNRCIKPPTLSAIKVAVRSSDPDTEMYLKALCLG